MFSKQVKILAAVCALCVIAACSADNIRIIDGAPGSGSGANSSMTEDSQDDNVDNEDFAGTITVTWSGSSASVSGDSFDYVTVSGADVSVNNTGGDSLAFVLTGASSSGSFRLDGQSRQVLYLEDLSLTNPSGAAINIQSGKKSYVVLEGENSLSDSSSASYSTDGDEDMKGVFFSEGPLVFSGDGSLTVKAQNAAGKSGIVSDDYIRLMEGDFAISVSAGSSAGHALKANDYVRISGGTLSVSVSAAGKKGITTDGQVLIEGGTQTINISGGVVKDSSTNDYSGSAGIKADNYFAMTGGDLTIKNTGSGGKGIRAGTDSYASPGTSYISGGSANISTTGSESNSVSSKGIKVGWVTKSGNSVKSNTGDFEMRGGILIVSSSKSEALEAKGEIKISGGELWASSSADDAVNSQGDMTISDGYVYAYSSKNDALDANGNLYLSGGYVFAVCTAGSPEVAIDANTEDRKQLYINSGVTLVAYGGLESGYSASQTVYSMSCTAGSWNSLYNGSSNIAAFKAPSGVSSVAVSAPSLSSGYKGVSVSGDTYCNVVWAADGISGGTSVSLSNYSGGGSNSGGPGGGGGFGGGGRW